MAGAGRIWPDTAAARRRFDRAAASFSKAAFVHDEARERLLSRLDFLRIEPSVIVDVGAGPGAGSIALQARFPAARIIALDSSVAMARAAAGVTPAIQSLAADAAALPLADGSVDLLFANLVLPWCDPAQFAAEAARVLGPDGLLLLSTTGPDTLLEVRRAWRDIDSATHVHPSLDMHDLADLLGRAGLAEPLADVDRMTVTYRAAQGLLADLTGCGGRNAAPARLRGLTSRRRWQRFLAALDAGREDGRLGISIELIFAQAWGRRGPAGTAEIEVPIGRIGRRR